MNSNIVTATSDVGMCTEALLSLGANAISSFDESTNEASVASNLYASARDDLLARHEWNVAIARAVLSPANDLPAWGYSKKYIMPADCIRLLGVVDLAATGQMMGRPVYSMDYAIEDGCVLSNSNNLGIHYIRRHDNVAAWPPAMVRLMVLRLRWAFAFPITKDGAMEGTCASIFAAELKTFKTLNGQQSPAIEIQGEALMTSRF